MNQPDYEEAKKEIEREVELFHNSAAEAALSQATQKLLEALKTAISAIDELAEYKKGERNYHSLGKEIADLLKDSDAMRGLTLEKSLRKLGYAKLEEAPKELSVNKIATTLKDIDFPFMKCVSKERVNEAYWDIAQALHDIASPIINRLKAEKNELHDQIEGYLRKYCIRMPVLNELISAPVNEFILKNIDKIAKARQENAELKQENALLKANDKVKGE